MKEIKRLAASAVLQNNPDGYLTLNVKDFDGGPFNLQPYIADDAVILPSGSRPAYEVLITGDPDALNRLGKALQTVARNAAKDDDSADE